MDEIIGVFSYIIGNRATLKISLTLNLMASHPYVHITGSSVYKKTILVSAAVKPVVDISSLKNENALG